MRPRQYLTLERMANQLTVNVRKVMPGFPKILILYDIATDVYEVRAGFQKIVLAYQQTSTEEAMNYAIIRAIKDTVSTELAMIDSFAHAAELEELLP